MKLATVEAWFEAHGFEIFDFQRQVWRAYADGESGLLHAPTGSGKSLAAWFAPILCHSDTVQDQAPPLTVLWVTPLRALAVDTHHNLQAAAQQLDLPWSIELRTGDTKAAQRARQRKRLPTAN